jgi:hypothetical protein
MDRMESLIAEIKRLEKELSHEIQKKETEFYYKIQGKKVIFEEIIRQQHKSLKIKIHTYIFNAAFLNILTAPVIWSCLIPTVFMDCIISIYQAICFPVYGIPKVVRSDYIVIDRNALNYLNKIEKINCIYCGYVNGLIAYVQEIAARTEQYWCPIKHSRKMAVIHSRYRNFFEYGDGEGFRKKYEELRKSFRDS